MKILAALILIFCGFLTGLELKKRLELRVRFLEECEAACVRLEGMIGFESAPLGELLPRINDSFGLFCGSAERMNKGSDFPGAWESALDGCKAAGHLTISERQAVAEIGRRLGRCGREAERENLRSARMRVHEEYEKAYSEYSQKCKVYFVCGSLGGMLCALVLI